MNRRVELQNSSGTEATEGPAGWTGVSTCRTTCFPKRNRVSCSWWPSHHVSYETSIIQAELETWTTEPESENVKENVSESENVWTEGS